MLLTLLKIAKLTVSAKRLHYIFPMYFKLNINAPRYLISDCIESSSSRPPLTPMNAKQFQRISGKEAIPEYKVQDVQASRFIILHYSLFKIVWDWMILICTFYIAVMVPYNAAFSLDTDGKDLLICDIIVELLFIIGECRQEKIFVSTN